MTEMVAQAVNNLGYEISNISGSLRQNIALQSQIISQLRNIAFRIEQLNRWEEVTKLKDEVIVLHEETKEIREIMSDPDKGILLSPNEKPFGFLPHSPYGRYAGMGIQQAASLKMALQGDERKLEIVQEPPTDSIEDYIEQFAYKPEKALIEEIKGDCVARSFIIERKGQIQVIIKNPGEKEPRETEVVCSCLPLNFEEKKEISVPPEGTEEVLFEIPVLSSRWTTSPYYIQTGKYTVNVRTEDDNDQTKLEVVRFSSQCGDPLPAEDDPDDEIADEDDPEDTFDDPDDPSEREEEHEPDENGEVELDEEPDPDHPIDASIGDFPV